MTDTLPRLVEPNGLTTRIERAAYWLDQAVRVDEVMGIRDELKRIEFAARQAKDRKLVADAIEYTLKSERRLGQMLSAAREAGQLLSGRPKKRSNSEHFPQHFTLEEAGIDRKLSMKAQQLAGKAPALFEQVIAEARAKIEAGKAIVVNPLKELNTADKQLRRRIREAQLAQRQRALPDKLYGVIYADPEWDFEVRSERGQDRAAANHYPTSDLATIKARPVGTLAAPDCALFVWGTVPMLPQALEVLRFWGFEYKSHFVWDKLEAGTGYWNRNRHEILIVATRGSVPAPAPGTQWPSLIQSRPAAHSEKPDWAYELIEAYFPNLPRIELNARRLRPGWDAWGLEAPEPENNETVPLSESHEGQVAQERTPESDGGSESSAIPLQRSSGAGAQLPDSLQAEPGSSPRAGEESQAKAGEAAAAGDAAADDPAGRLAGGRTPAATSERMDATAGETADAGGDLSTRDSDTPPASPSAPALRSPARSVPPPDRFGDPSRLPAAEEAYLALVAADTLKGRHTRETAEAIVRAAYACDPIVPVKQLAEDLGHKLNTVLSWAKRCGLSSVKRRDAALAATRAARHPQQMEAH